MTPFSFSILFISLATCNRLIICTAQLRGEPSYDIDIALDNMMGKVFAERVNEYLAMKGYETHNIGTRHTSTLPCPLQTRLAHAFRVCAMCVCACVRVCVCAVCGVCAGLASSNQASSSPTPNSPSTWKRRPCACLTCGSTLSTSERRATPSTPAFLPRWCPGSSCRRFVVCLAGGWCRHSRQITFF